VEALTIARARPSWSSWSEIPPVITAATNLRKSVSVALLVGTTFVSLNQLETILAGEATPLTWIKAALTYVVPFCVSNYGIVAASRR
jgi:hypothetical protein